MKLRTKIALMACLPVIVVGIIAVSIAASEMKKSITSEVFSGMEAAALSISNIFTFSASGDYNLVDGELWKGEELNISQSHEIVDEIKSMTGLDVTVFYGDTRYLTSIKDDSGNRQVGTKASDVVVNEVLKKGNYYGDDNVKILGTRYLGYYIPITNEGSSTPVGMIFLGQDFYVMNKAIFDATVHTVVPILIFVALSALASIIISAKLVKVINNGISFLERLKNGDLGLSLPERLLARKDVLGDMSRSIQALDDKLINIISHIQEECAALNLSSATCLETSNAVLSSFEEINASVQEVAAATTTQAKESDDASSNIHRMGYMIENTTTHVNDISKISADMDSASSTAKDTLEELSKSMKSVESAVESISVQTDQTHESVQKINEVTEMIANIASQTNLLSLNASIEAARAGEHGKGFAVVAAEIQQLADQSNNSAMQIHEMLDELQSNSEQAVSSMNTVKEIVHVQSNKIKETHEIFTTLETGIFDSSKGIEKINYEAMSLDNARKETISQVENVSSASQDIASSMEQTAESVESVTSMVIGLKDQAESLKDIADNLEESISIFKLK